MNRQKRVAAIHDISCFGRCSLTVALPIISAAGIETTLLPTAVLSTHTGGFSGFTYRDLTRDIRPIISHWDSIGLTFDAVYTGFLGSFEQIDIVSDIFDKYKKRGALIAVDPVMGDNGSLYKIFGPDFPKGMAHLCAKADIIVPNITEALLLLGEPYREGLYTEAFIRDIMERLAALGPEKVVLTGVWFKQDKLGAAAYDKKTGKISYALTDRVEGSYHGTGDVFASALVSALLHEIPLEKAIRIAVDFTVGSIRRTREAGTDVRFGVNFEEGLAELAAEIKTAEK